MTSRNDDIRKAAVLIRNASRAICLTGAGYSTPSGIPDFRSANSGIWERVNPMEVASLSTFRFQPQKFFAWFRPLAKDIFSAQPNPAHYALAELEKAGHFAAVITQNIDGLHHRAGSKQVYEIHGTLARMVCTQCHTPYPADTHIEAYVSHGTIPTCPACEHILKPDVVLFEEQLPYHTWQRAENAVREADLMLVAGSSLQVMPAARLPATAAEKGIPLIVINKTPTYIDEHADVVLRGDVAEILPQIVREVTGV